MLVDNLALQVRLGASHAGDTTLQIVVGCGLGRDRAGLGYAIGDLHFIQVHVVDDTLHHFDRASGTGHDPGAQMAQVQRLAFRMVEHGDEHGRHTVHASGFFFGCGLQRGKRLEGGTRINHRGAMGHAAEVTHDHAEAVIQRHRNHQPVMLGELQAFTNHVAVVEDVVVTEGGAFGEPRGARGVLNIDRVVELQLFAILTQLFRAYTFGHVQQTAPQQHAVHWLVA